MEQTAATVIDMEQTATAIEIEARVRAAIFIGLLIILLQAIRSLRQAWVQGLLSVQQQDDGDNYSKRSKVKQ
jgi:hypothetical protein